MRREINYKIADLLKFKEALLKWAQQFHEVVWFDSNDHEGEYSSFDGLLAADALTAMVTDHHNAFEELKTYQAESKDWLFGYLSYDLKNDVEQLSSLNADGLGFADMQFFQPKRIIRIKGNQVNFCYLNMVADEIEEDFKAITNQSLLNGSVSSTDTNIHIKLRIFKDDYFKRVGQLLARIHRGDIYEANFCQEFYVEDTSIDPLLTFQKLNAISKPPFATFLKFKDTYALSASPERYIKKQGSKIISQPIKGTAKRSLDVKEDELLKLNLENDPKERAENIMI
ncbi:MAG: chorismate-binding protein, partial [Flavobacteriales bacterium]